MKRINSNLLILVVLIAVTAVYRLIPNRPLGFAPQIAIALFAGAVMKDKKWVFALPLFSMLLSDLLFQILYIGGNTTTPGFYQDQWINYLLILSVTVIGFGVKKDSIVSIATGAIAAPVLYFIVSNGIVWATNTGLGRALNWTGLMQTYTDGLPFFKGTLWSSIIFSGLFFGSFHLLSISAKKLQKAPIE